MAELNNTSTLDALSTNKATPARNAGNRTPSKAFLNNVNIVAKSGLKIPVTGVFGLQEKSLSKSMWEKVEALGHDHEFTLTCVIRMSAEGRPEVVIAPEEEF